MKRDSIVQYLPQSLTVFIASLWVLDDLKCIPAATCDKIALAGTGKYKLSIGLSPACRCRSASCTSTTACEQTLPFFSDCKGSGRASEYSRYVRGNRLIYLCAARPIAVFRSSTCLLCRMQQSSTMSLHGSDTDNVRVDWREDNDVRVVLLPSPALHSLHWLFLRATISPFSRPMVPIQ